jgi:hypothetical protein
MKWPIFLDSVLKGNFKNILDIKDIKLIAGGFNLAIDYLYFDPLFNFYIASDTLFSSSTVHPGLVNTNFDQFWRRFLHLSTLIPMFPHPQDLIASASKVQRDNDLMVVAATVTKTPFPKSIILNTPEDLRAACRNQGLVIKRDFSDSNTCTYLPAPDREQKIMAKQAETQKLYHGIRDLPLPTWMGQPFIPPLVEKGELRALVSGGKVKYVIHTCPDSQGRAAQEIVDSITPLHYLK